MIVKNVWSEPREYIELDGLKLLPGDTADLSSFSSKRIQECKELQNDFTKGYCVCIGKGIVRASTKDDFLREARNRALGIERQEYQKKIPAKTKIIPPKLSSFDKRSIYSKLDKNLKEKEKREYKEVFKKKPEVFEQENKNDKLVVVDPQKGRVSVTPIPAQKTTIIDLEPFKEHIRTVQHYELPKPEKEEDEKDKEVHEILERIKDKPFNAVPMCGGVNRWGRACNKRAVRGYKHCAKHMDEEERIDYENKKRGTKFTNITGEENGNR